MAEGPKINLCVASDASSQQQFRMQQKEQERGKRRLERRLKETEESIKNLEQRQEELSLILADPGTYQDQAVYTMYVDELEAIQGALLEIYRV